MPFAGESDLKLAGLGLSAHTKKIDLQPHNQIKQLLKQARDSLPLGGVSALLFPFGDATREAELKHSSASELQQSYPTQCPACKALACIHECLLSLWTAKQYGIYFGS